MEWCHLIPLLLSLRKEFNSSDMDLIFEKVNSILPLSPHPQFLKHLEAIDTSRPIFKTLGSRKTAKKGKALIANPHSIELKTEIIAILLLVPDCKNSVRDLATF